MPTGEIREKEVRAHPSHIQEPIVIQLDTVLFMGHALGGPENINQS